MNSDETEQITRRNFLKTSAAGSLTVQLLSAGLLTARAEGAGTLRVGLVGCGGRGTGAAAQAMAADKNVKLVAMGDAFEDRLQSSLKTLKTQAITEKVDVPSENCFVGFNAYMDVI